MRVPVLMRCVLVACWACLLGLGAGLPLGAEPGEQDPDVLRPAWLIGVWRFADAEGEGRLELDPDGVLRLALHAKGQDEVTLAGRWSVKGQQLVLADGSDTAAFALERLPEEGGRRRARFLTPGQPAAVFTQDPPPALPAWLPGTWSLRGQGGTLRMVVLPSGALRVVRVRQGRSREVTSTTWTASGDLLTFQAEGREQRARVERRADGAEGPRAAFRDEPAGAAPGSADAAPALVFTRLPPGPAGEAYQGPLLGRWSSPGTLPGLALELAPDGTYLRRRDVPPWPQAEPGRFRVTQGALGSVLTLTDLAGRTRRYDALLGPGQGALRLKAQPPEAGTVELTLEAGSAEAVAMAARDRAAEHGDVVTGWAEFHGYRRLDPAPGEAADPAAPRPDQDPHPTRVQPGAEVAVQVEVWTAIPEPGPADVAARRPREERWEFLPNGRVEQRDTGTAGVEPHAPPPEPVRRRWGSYGLVGGMLVVTFDDGSEERLRLLEGGRYLSRGEVLLQHMHVTRLASSGR